MKYPLELIFEFVIEVPENESLSESCGIDGECQRRIGRDNRAWANRYNRDVGVLDCNCEGHIATVARRVIYINGEIVCPDIR